jgi:hypothetical protein
VPGTERAPAHRIEGDLDVRRLVDEDETARALARLLERLGHHHRDGLIGVAHRGVLQRLDGMVVVGVSPETPAQARAVLVREHGEHAGHRLGGRGFDACDAPLRDGAGHQHRVRQIREPMIRRVRRGARDLGAAVYALEGRSYHARHLLLLSGGPRRRSARAPRCAGPARP